jgi:phage FluMu gp28-like protein
MAFKPLRTVIRFTNGSVIEAFPNNPDTIRGPTLDIVYCDEMNFLPNDEEMYDAILFTLSTTNGKFVCSSTPWNQDSIFYKIFFHKGWEDFAKHHVTWQRALEPNGPLKKKILEKIRRQFAEDPWRWKREMEAEWAEDETTWLPQSLITKCIDGNLELWDFESYQEGKFLAGLDLGKLQDYSVLIVVEEVDGRYQLRHWKVFPLGTKYATVIGYVKTLCDRWRHIERIRVDITGVGEYVVEDMQNAGIDAEVEGVTFTLPRKQEMASLLKQRMLNGAYRFPFAQLRLSPTLLLSYVAELNVERFELRKDGAIAFSHPQGQHDDTFWATCLSLYCAVKMAPEPYLGVVSR